MFNSGSNLVPRLDPRLSINQSGSGLAQSQPVSTHAPGSRSSPLRQCAWRHPTTWYRTRLLDGQRFMSVVMGSTHAVLCARRSAASLDGHSKPPMVKDGKPMVTLVTRVKDVATLVAWSIASPNWSIASQLWSLTVKPMVTHVASPPGHLVNRVAAFLVTRVNPLVTRVAPMVDNVAPPWSMMSQPYGHSWWSLGRSASPLWSIASPQLWSLANVASRRPLVWSLTSPLIWSLKMVTDTSGTSQHGSLENMATSRQTKQFSLCVKTNNRWYRYRSMSSLARFGN